ncbi:MAG: hypothetical protein EP349_10260 [Alphaproteobacteria bacterium]|nr:MAG: hypothetical protein EP349_10260 [Alphaproteobacteria bacterium]
MSCDAYYYIRRAQEDIDELRDDMRRSFKDQAKKIDAQRIEMPAVIVPFKKSGDKERYSALDDTTALYFRRVGDDMLRMYELDFGLSMATISTIQGNTITATETKKLSEMPPKMVKEARSRLPGNGARNDNTVRHSVKRR